MTALSCEGNQWPIPGREVNCAWPHRWAVASRENCPEDFFTNPGEARNPSFLEGFRNFFGRRGQRPRLLQFGGPFGRCRLFVVF